MLSSFNRSSQFVILSSAIGLAAAAPANGQISIGLNVGITDNAVCVGGGDSETLGVSNTGECGPGQGFTAAPWIQIGPDTSYVFFDGSTGASEFTGPATFGNDVDFNGDVDFTDTVSFAGTSTTFASPTFFTFASTFQAQATFNAAMNTSSINNSGTINSTNVNVTGSFTAAPGTTINMGGVNRIQGVAAGINPLDAVNMAQLMAATAGSQYIDINSDGPAASATGVDAIAIGESAVASADDAVAIGRGSTASGTDSIAIGRGAVATGSIAIGAGSSASSGGSAFGDLANATGGNSTAIGEETVATGLSSTALGYQAVASGTASSALGHNSDATALGATAVGVSAQATQNFATSVGRIANASGVGATALGNASSATADNSVALGSGSVANQANTVSVGAAGSERRIVNVAAGTATTDAVNLGQLNVVANNVSALQAAQDIIAGQVDMLFDLRSRDRRDMKQGVASAMAMASAPMPSEPGRIAYAVNGATFRGEYAIGGSLTYRLPTAKPMAVNVGFSYAGNKNNGARVGVAGEF